MEFIFVKKKQYDFIPLQYYFRITTEELATNSYECTLFNWLFHIYFRFAL